MIFRNYNDFEIVNMIKSGNQEAFQFLVDKYKFFIAKMIRKFNLTKDFDDVFQESLMTLYKSALKFEEKYNKTFMRFFELTLTNRLITIKNKEIKYSQFIHEKSASLYNLTIYEQSDNYFTEKEIKEALIKLSEYEKLVFNTKILGKLSVRETAKKLNCDEKKIYNALERIKNKLKIHLLS